MPSLGEADMHTDTITAVSPQRTTHAPLVCSAYLPTSMTTSLPPTGIVNCLKFIFLHTPCLFLRPQHPLRTDYKKGKRTDKLKLARPFNHYFLKFKAATIARYLSMSLLLR